MRKVSPSKSKTPDLKQTVIKPLGSWDIFKNVELVVSFCGGSGFSFLYLPIDSGIPEENSSGCGLGLILYPSLPGSDGGRVLG